MYFRFGAVGRDGFLGLMNVSGGCSLVDQSRAKPAGEEVDFSGFDIDGFIEAIEKVLDNKQELLNG